MLTPLPLTLMSLSPTPIPSPSTRTSLPQGILWHNPLSRSPPPDGDQTRLRGKSKTSFASVQAQAVVLDLDSRPSTETSVHMFFVVCHIALRISTTTSSSRLPSDTQKPPQICRTRRRGSERQPSSGPKTRFTGQPSLRAFSQYTHSSLEVHQINYVRPGHK